MNRSLLLVICDFLLLSLLALARFDAPTQEETAEESVEVESVTAESELVDVLKLTLESEREQQQQLQSALESANQAIEEREKRIQESQQKLSETEERLDSEQQTKAELLEHKQLLEQEKGDLAKDILRIREEKILERERLRQAQMEIEKKEAEIEKTLETVSQIEEEKETLQQEKQEALTQLEVAKTRQQLVSQQLENTKLEIEVERQQRLAAEKRAENLTEGVRSLAGTSAEIKEEIKQLQPKTPNALFTEYKRNRVTVKFDTEYPGIFQSRNKTYETQTLLISDTRQTYAVLHASDSPFDIRDVTPSYESVTATIQIGDSILHPQKVHFLASDPRIVLLPVDSKVVEEENIKAYPIVLEPFRFPKSVVVDSGQNYFGESSFKLQSNYSHALEMDRKIISQLFGEFSPSRGDLVLAQTGEFMGVMATNQYAILMDHLSISDSLWVGEGFDGEYTDTILQKLNRKVLTLGYWQ